MRNKFSKKLLVTAICTSLAILSSTANAGRPPNKPAYLWGSISVGQGITNVPLTGVNAYDYITVRSLLQSGDVGEDVEGEILSWGGGGSTGGTVEHYWATQVNSFIASYDNPNYTAGIFGADGEESAYVIIDVDPAPPPKWVPDDIKATAQTSSNFAENNATALGTAKEVCDGFLKAGKLAMKSLCTFISTSQKLEEGWSQALNEIANDPSDPNFRVIAQPVTPVIAPLLIGDLPQSVFDAFNALSANQAESIGVMRAIITSTNRATGAYDANEDTWMAAQAAAGVKFRVQLGGLVQQKIILLTNLQTVLQAAGITTIPLNSSNIFNYEYNLMYYGFSSDEIQLYTELGFSADYIDMARKRMASRSYLASAGAYPDMLTASNYVTSLQNLADTLQYVPLSEGQEAKAEGLFNSSTGSVITFELRVAVKNSALVGEFEVKDHASANSFGFESTSLTRAGTRGNKIVVEGNYIANDNTNGSFKMSVVKGDGGNSKGSISIVLSNGLTLTGTLAGGHVKMP